ncbi:phosphatidylserine decarboxylase-domain-containing protein [Aspergillus karnatakaensis]|uniref:phosphatidylserine decarboxylase n=1 Tax=Aspergillus karnatakaensis TaxID=1810916 RepID=UPI003CCE4BC4
MLSRALAYIKYVSGGVATPEDTHNPLIQELQHWILSDSSRKRDFEAAVAAAKSYNINEMQNIQSLEHFLTFLNEQLHWIPTEAIRPKDLLHRLTITWLIFDQPPIRKYQSPIRPIVGQHQEPDELTWLSTWMIRYSNAIGHFMDTPASASELTTFRSNPAYRMNDYIEPRSGWKTFNEFFSRHVKPGRRPIAAIGDNSVVTSPADFEFKEMHRITAASRVTTKGLSWPIAQMLVDSPYKDRFAGGVWLHGFLNVDDYHRVHAPVAGTVVEARVIQGQNYMQVEAHGPRGEGGAELSIPNETGYQFCQSRGLVIIDTGGGLVAVLPVGMALVSSVILTAELGAQLHKGEELGYFQFGGSDVVLIFEGRLNTQITMLAGQHYKMGEHIGHLSPEESVP